MVLFSCSVYAQYIPNESRQKEADNYLNSIRKGREFSNTKSSGFEMNEQAVQEMVNRWKGKSGTESTEKMRLELERMKQKKIQDAVSKNANDEAQEEYKNMCAFITNLYVANGLIPFEAESLSTRRIGEKLRKNGLRHDFFYVSDPEADIAIAAFNSYRELKETAGFDQLSELIYDFRMLGYSATLALDHLEKRFPEKKEIINYLKPHFGISYFSRNRRYYITSNEQEYNFMVKRLKEWFDASPLQVVQAHFNDAFQRDFLGVIWAFRHLLDSATLEKRPQMLKDLVLASAQATCEDNKRKRDFLLICIQNMIAGQGQFEWIVDKKKKKEIKNRLELRKEFHKLFTYEDFQVYKDGYKFLDNADIINFLYLEGVKLQDKDGNKHLIEKLK